MLLDRLVVASQAVSATRSRRQKTGLLSQVLSETACAEVGLAAAYLVGMLPQGRIGLGYAAIREATADPSPAAPQLSLAEVDRRFAEMTEASGPGSIKKKRELFAALLSSATEGERAFLKRLVLGELRQGALDGIMVEAVANAFDISSTRVRRATMLAGDVSTVAAAIAKEGPRGLERFALSVFSPVLPMLAHPAEDAEAALARLGTASFEVKVDGARVQAHKDGNDVRLFSRRLNDVTGRIPEVADAVRGLPVRRAILDGEAIALDHDRRPMPFQTTMRRFGRKRDVQAMQRELPITGLFFDALLIDDQTLLDASTSERHEALASCTTREHRVSTLITNDASEVDAFFTQTVAQGHEGLMAKDLGAPYEAGSRGKTWLKLKPAHTLDLVVLAAEWGSGRREGWLSNLHLGARDPESGGFVMLGKTFKGMTDELLAWQTQALTERAVGPTNEWVVPVRPELVVEIAFNDVQESSHYPGGVALRFARVKRYRPDKNASEADTIHTVRALGHPDPGRKTTRRR